jgi:hypothetical protein
MHTGIVMVHAFSDRAHTVPATAMRVAMAAERTVSEQGHVVTLDAQLQQHAKAQTAIGSLIVHKHHPHGPNGRCCRGGRDGRLGEDDSRGCWGRQGDKHGVL